MSRALAEERPTVSTRRESEKRVCIPVLFRVFRLRRVLFERKKSCASGFTERVGHVTARGYRRSSNGIVGLPRMPGPLRGFSVQWLTLVEPTVVR